MIVTIVERTDEQLADYDYRDAFQINIDGQKKFFVSDGEPEDANLGRDFSDVYKIGELMTLAYEAGKRGEDLVFTNEAFDE